MEITTADTPRCISQNGLVPPLDAAQDHVIVRLLNVDLSKNDGVVNWGAIMPTSDLPAIRALRPA